MGSYDTILFYEDIICPTCGKAIHTMQTKIFDCTLSTIETGDLVETSTVYGIIQDQVYCDHKESAYMEEKYTLIEVFLIIWNKMLIGVKQTLDEANYLLENYSIGDLHRLYVKLFESNQKLFAKYKSLINLIDTYADYISLSEEERIEIERDCVVSLEYKKIQSFMNEKNPLTALIKHVDNVPQIERHFEISEK